MNSGNQSAFVMIADQLDDEVHKRWLESDYLHSCSEAEFHDRPDLERGIFEVYAEHNHGLTTSDVINAKHAHPAINMNVNVTCIAIHAGIFCSVSGSKQRDI